jgi:flavin-dependent dehydrogenase
MFALQLIAPVLGGGIFLSMYSGDLCADMILAILACLS